MNNDIITVYVGYDSREEIAYKVCEYSILKHTPGAEVKPLKQQLLRSEDLYWRSADPLSSTEFTFTRFLVPHLQNHEGWALFCDCDFVWDGNLAELFELADPRYAVMVVKHDHQPQNDTKMDGCKQTIYPRKNWSSCVLWNCSHPSNIKLTLADINDKPGSYLHRFQWLEDHEIGELPAKYNFLVGWNSEEKTGKPIAYHWTEGGPWFPEYRDCDYKDVWNQYLLDYATEVGRHVSTVNSPITWVTSLSREYYNYAAQHTLPSWKSLPGEVVFVWDDKPVDLGFGRAVSFYKEVVGGDDPWVSEGMGGTKADRFWKKSRAQIWAARKYKGLVIWIDADISVQEAMSRTKAFELLHPGDKVWASLDCGVDWPHEDDCPIDTGIVAFNTKHEQFDKFIRDYSLTWYNGDIYKIPQPYDHHAANLVREKWPMRSLVPHFNQWVNVPQGYISRLAMENSYIKKYFYHHLGIDRKAELSLENKERVEKKKEKK